MSASRQRTRRLVTDHDRFTRFLLEDHTVPQLANSLVPVQSDSNVLPLSRRLNLRHRVLASLPTRLSQSTLLALRDAGRGEMKTGVLPLGGVVASEKLRKQAKPKQQAALVRCSYPSYHQLHCPNCQAQARHSIEDAIRHMALVEAQKRQDAAVEEQSLREALYQSMKRERRLLTQRLLLEEHNTSGEMTSGVPTSSHVPSEFFHVAEELQRVERDERVSLARSLWRKLRVVQCAAREWILHLQESSDSVAPGVSAQSPKHTTLESSVASCLRKAEELSGRVAEVARTHHAAWVAAQRELCTREVECRLVIEEDFMTSASCTLSIAAVDWRVAASRSQEERVKSEKADERSRVAASETQARMLLTSVEDASRKTIVAQFADAHREYANRLFEVSVSTLVSKEFKARADRVALFLSEREATLVRAATVEQKELRQRLERGEVRERTVVQDEHSRWLAERTDEDVLQCQAAAAATLADRSVATAQRVVLSEAQKEEEEEDVITRRTE